MPSNAVVVCSHAGSCPLPVSVLDCCRHHAGSCPLPVSVCPCLSHHRCRHLSLARQHPHLPLSSRQLSSLARQHPPLPAIVVAATATNGNGRAWHTIAVRRRPCRPAPALAVPSISAVQRGHNHCCHQALFSVAAAAAVAAKPRAFWAK